MSSTDGEKETWMASTRVKSNPQELRQYRFPWMKWIVDKLFPASTLDVDADRGVALRARR
jgi:hypothetical protein